MIFLRPQWIVEPFNIRTPCLFDPVKIDQILASIPVVANPWSALFYYHQATYLHLRWWNFESSFSLYCASNVKFNHSFVEWTHHNIPTAHFNCLAMQLLVSSGDCTSLHKTLVFDLLLYWTSCLKKKKQNAHRSVSLSLIISCSLGWLSFVSEGEDSNWSNQRNSMSVKFSWKCQRNPETGIYLTKSSDSVVLR